MTILRHYKSTMEHPQPSQGVRAWLKDILKKTVFCFVFALLAKYVGVLFLHFPETLNPLSNKIEDFELSDLCFAHGHRPIATDSTIFIFREEAVDRNAMAREIGRLEKAGVKAIGIDLTFNSYVQERDLALIDTINQYKDNIVLGMSAADPDDMQRLPFYQQMFTLNDEKGDYNFGYLIAEDREKTKRYFMPYIKKGADTLNSFSVELFTIADSIALNALQKRKTREELINYRQAFRNESLFMVFDTVPEDVSFSGKIALIGFTDATSIVDRHFTPLNDNSGRSLPDMAGVMYHAQIIAMILRADFLSEPGEWLKYGINFLAIFLFMIVYNYLFRFHGLYHLLTEILFLFFLVPISLTICLLLLNHLNLKIEPTDYIIPVFLSGIGLHLYDPFLQLLKRLKNTFHPLTKVAHGHP